MDKFTVNFAGILIGITARHKFMKAASTDYITESDYTDFDIEATEQEILKEEAELSIGELEALALYRKIAAKLYEYDAFLLHGVALDVESRGIIFTAKSGTGKSTHAMLWKKLFGDRCIIVNGDKPIVRFIDGIPYAFGTPFAGKEGYQTNMKTPVRDLAFINRSADNFVEKSENNNILARFMASCHIPQNPPARLKTFELLGRFIEKVNFWDIYCNMDINAAKVAAEQIRGGRHA